MSVCKFSCECVSVVTGECVSVVSVCSRGELT